MVFFPSWDLLWAPHVPLREHWRWVHRTTLGMRRLSQPFLNSDFFYYNYENCDPIQLNLYRKSFRKFKSTKKWFWSFSTRSCLSCQISLLEDSNSFVLGAHGPRFPVFKIWMNLRTKNPIGFEITSKKGHRTLLLLCNTGNRWQKGRLKVCVLNCAVRFEIHPSTRLSENLGRKSTPLSASALIVEVSFTPKYR